MSRPGFCHRSLLGLMLEPTKLKACQFRRVGYLAIYDGGYETVRQAFSAGGLKERFFQEYDGLDKYTMELV